jgi:cbb3-type cytochrome oxidase maturation protein
LIPVSLGLGALGLVAFFWALKADQFSDPKGDGARILLPDWDDHPDTPKPGHRKKGVKRPGHKPDLKTFRR